LVFLDPGFHRYDELIRGSIDSICARAELRKSVQVTRRLSPGTVCRVCDNHPFQTRQNHLVRLQPVELTVNNLMAQ
jgi:hypothetical protein